jgi:uridine kinase
VTGPGTEPGTGLEAVLEIGLDVEAGAPLSPGALARRVARWAEPGAAVLVAVDGPSGAGKTSLAENLVAALPGAVVVHLDDVYPGWDGLEAAAPLLVRHVLAPLRCGAPVTLPTWDWAREVPGPPRVLPALGPPRPPVVVEGAGAGARACAPYLDGLIWLEAPEDVRRARTLIRDGDAYAPHWERWARQERAHFRREGTRERADLVLDSSAEAGNCVVVRDLGR